MGCIDAEEVRKDRQEVACSNAIAHRRIKTLEGKGFY